MGLQPWHWAVIGMLLMIGELFIPSFAMLWFGVAALVTALLLWVVPMDLLSQVVIWLGLSIVVCILWFRLIQPRIKTRTKAGLGGSVIVGEIGMIVSPVLTNGLGVVRFSVPKVGAAEWACRTLDGRPIEVGTRVIVTAVMGNELIVIPK
ncbi:NfeD family protein [Moraxella catarrhalis]|uniref:Putative activity regulator of membrane protease YbbK n=1 Tax=Moraxella catarrhalis TaxID=480 RepID=A0A198UHG7_MORCA|nr:NfeD family protein [Moraxella catarrhalis]OAU95749.1 putative activity regulator of membrane protease YbbK [Moraxella catarrhalis]OAU96929.1 putative activity regulator of membrane protease YbbK [Moraxella catarrhalis]OAU98629.1 putative activity regulator of membrane protease YbbK [Moraxella catarrhalis]OAV01647.1 putative activity regulator of membrane protease YbbK [Moraxella catarrhalis]